VPCVGAGVASADRDLNNSFEHMFAFLGRVVVACGFRLPLPFRRPQ
jgi:hypothetical protein